MDEQILLKVEHLCQYFKSGSGEIKAVDDVSFDIKKGEVFGLVGESGCGKTTTGRAIIKLYRITSGNIWFKGRRISAGVRSYQDAIRAARAECRRAEQTLKNRRTPEAARARTAAREKCEQLVARQREQIRLARIDQTQCNRLYAAQRTAEIEQKYAALLAAAEPAQRQRLEAEKRAELRSAQKQRLITQIQMIFQDPIASLDPRMTVKETVSEGLVIRGERDRRQIDEQVYQVLERVGLVREHAGRYPHEFSGGQRQRIGVARAVIMHPELIIADEPVSALDVSIQAQVINLLNKLRRELGLTILFIAHDLSVVKYFSDRIGVMYNGRLVELAASEELFHRPLHPYTRSLLSAIPLPDPNYEKKRRRLVYNPLAEHDYTTDKPSFREVLPGHFVQCNSAEFEKYRAALAAQDESDEDE